jgi:hypothetical protein
VTDAYVCRLLPLTCLAMSSSRSVGEREPKGLRLANLLGNERLNSNEQLRSLTSECIEKFFCIPKINGPEAFGEPIVDRGNQLAGLRASALVAQQMS